MDNCIFCKIVAGQIPAKKIHEDDEIIVIEDIAPAAPVHLLLVPKKHIVNCLDLEPEDGPVIGRLYQTAARIAKEKGFAENGFRIVNNNNSDGGQSVYHIHFHLLAGRHLGWPPG